MGVKVVNTCIALWSFLALGNFETIPNNAADGIKSYE
jgi:hypothetical protein